ncbi:MAG: ribonuclease HIII [Verrucomicrobiota bacterium]
MPSNPPSSYTFEINEAQGERLKAILEEKGFDFRDLSYGYFAAKLRKCGVNYYHSGKIVVNGKDAKEFIEFYLEPLVLQTVVTGYEQYLAKEQHPEMFEPHFGVDEAGKGDFFGPLVIAGAYVNDVIAERLIEAGVKDSKRLTDKRAEQLTLEIEKIMRSNSGAWEVITIFPEKYNELYAKFRNLNRLLAWGHAKVIENLKLKIKNCPRALSDQFGNPRLIEVELKRKDVEIFLEQRPKAEQDIAVAAASILARWRFLQGLKKLSDQASYALLKGASKQVQSLAQEIAEKGGADLLEKVSKRHFKTFDEAMAGKLL